MSELKKLPGKIEFSLIAALAAAITILHFLILEKLEPHDVVLEELYYIPLFWGAVRFGLRGAAIAYIIVSFFYLPFMFAGWSATWMDLTNRVLHLVFTAVFAVIGGYFVDWEKKARQQRAREKYLADIGQVVTSIVHDQKNPVITILSYSRRIRDGKGDAQRSAQTIIDSAASIEKLVYDMLDFAKPSQFGLETGDARDAVRRASDICLAKGESKGVSLSIDLPDEELAVLMDAAQLQRALVNLIDNAIEASPAGRDVRIRAFSEKSSVVVSIRDHGEGLDEKTIENVFFPFYTKKSGGTGLGLPIAKKIIEGHNGIIRLWSRPAEGLEVVIALPEAGQLRKAA